MRDGKPASCSRMHHPLSTGIIRCFSSAPPPSSTKVQNGTVPLSLKRESGRHPLLHPMPDPLHDPTPQLLLFHANVPLSAPPVPFNSKVFVL